MKKIFSLTLLISSLIGMNIVAEDVINTSEEVQQEEGVSLEEFCFEEVAEEARKQIIEEAKKEGKELTEKELEEAVEQTVAEVKKIYDYLAASEKEKTA